MINFIMRNDKYTIDLNILIAYINKNKPNLILNKMSIIEKFIIVLPDDKIQIIHIKR